jgi:magnesium-transporting ATPase (P-type)
MALLAVLGFCITLPVMLEDPDMPLFDIIDRSLDLITITVPPALPAAMTFGTVFAV